jgi:CheY-like chemotaxis protein
VRDTGIGIQQDKISKIFSAFTQADSSTTRNFGGSGLGLAIVSRLTALMGGRVWVESEIGRGSVFRFTVELAEPAADESESSSKPDLRGLHAFIIDPNATSRMIITETLISRGAISDSAVSVPVAMTALSETPAEHRKFDVLLIDANSLSPEVLQLARGPDGFDQSVAIVVMLNSTGFTNRMKAIRELGLQYYVVKPLRRAELWSVVANAVAQRAPDSNDAGIPANRIKANEGDGTEKRPIRILLTDDSPDNRLLVCAYLKRGNYLVDEAQNGQVAVDRFMAASYDVVLMDIQMPVLDGYSAVRTIRQWEESHRRVPTPIIALTASALVDDVRRAKEAGCDMHVSKPVKKSTLLSAISSALVLQQHNHKSAMESNERMKPSSSAAEPEFA